jgi:hypothetical protein
MSSKQKVVTTSVQFDESNPNLVLVALGDIHHGHINTDYNLLKRDIATIARNPRWVVVLMGDLIQAWSLKHRLYNPSHHAPYLHGKTGVIRHQAKALVNDLKPIKKQIIGVLSGNHETTCHDEDDVNVYQDILDDLDLNDKALGSAGFLSIQHMTQFANSKGQGGRFNIYLQHGQGSGGHTAFHTHIRRLRDNFLSHMTFTGHTHVPDSTHSTRVFLSSQGVPYQHVWHGIGTRSYKNPYGVETWSARRGYPESLLGSVAVSITHKRSGSVVLPFVTGHRALDDIEDVLNAPLKGNNHD